ncbi:putative Zn-dependent protease [Angulomicrobium tetraedrale]|uniref:Putative Zn-dependent protease n=1 Tax=Ancylobacter tetraedralis TaxID=217068 RepID=A0A839Z7B1_9HYPH|nr:M48 family metalloprotease [Ancylobacter tetraedralis]MBB3770326.1 putative Zn-dependent protease [Ancylobacter tetraedralis]
MMLLARRDNPSLARREPRARAARPARLRQFALRAAGALACLATALPAGPVAAQQRQPTIIRDAEVESLLRDYTRPIFKAAGLQQQNIQIVIIGDDSFNAFVADGKRIFINTGTLKQSTTPGEVIGVLAHETGHIAGGHLSRMRQQLETAQTAAIVAMLLGVGAAAAGASSGASVGNAAAGAVLLPQEVARRTLLSYQRSQEQAADRSAVTYLDATKQSAKGLLTTMERLQNDQMFISQRIDPYVLSHPLARERVAALEDIAQKSPYFTAKDAPALQARHDMMRAKLVGFTQSPDSVSRVYPASNTSLPARYARAISAYRFGSIPDALRQIDALIAEQPGNPYFHEIKGQALLEAGRAREAVAPLRKAVSLSDGNPLIRMLLGQALVASNDKATMDEAVRELNFGLQREPASPLGWRYLAMAYGQRGDLPNADLASAQSAFLNGDFRLARELATRAKDRFPLGSPGWLKADDILNYKPPPQLVRRSSTP